MHGNALLVACQRQNGRALCAGQQGDDLVQTLARRVHHDVFGFAGLNNPLDTGQQFVDQLLLGFGHFAVALNQAGFRAVNDFHFTQTVGFKRCAGGHQIANRICQTCTRCDFYRAIQQTGFKRHPFLIEITFEQVWVRGSDTLTVQRCRAIPGFINRGCQRKTAAAEVQTAQGKIARVFTLCPAVEQFLFQNVFPDDAEVNDTVHHQTRDIVITYAQNIDRHILCHCNQALGVKINFNAATGQQFA